MHNSHARCNHEVSHLKKKSSIDSDIQATEVPARESREHRKNGHRPKKTKKADDKLTGHPEHKADMVQPTTDLQSTTAPTSHVVHHEKEGGREKGQNQHHHHSSAHIHEVDKRRATDEEEKSVGKRAKLESRSRDPHAHPHSHRAKARAHEVSRKFKSDPALFGGILSTVDLGLALVLGGLAYRYWNVPRWDRRILSGLALASVGLLSIEGWLAERLFG